MVFNPSVSTLTSPNNVDAFANEVSNCEPATTLAVPIAVKPVAVTFAKSPTYPFALSKFWLRLSIPFSKPVLSNFVSKIKVPSTAIH